MRRIDGHYFFPTENFTRQEGGKAAAKKEAAMIRKETGGNINARVVKTKSGYTVYTAFSKKFQKSSAEAKMRFARQNVRGPR